MRFRREFQPHIFSQDEIVRLLRAARELHTRPCDPLRPWSMELVVALLYTGGLRIGELARLQVRDYDPCEATLLIRETKFAKTRLVALSTAVHRVLEWYREGQDVQALLPRLVTYLGHRGLESTQHYLARTPSLLHEASGRFETFAATATSTQVVQS